MVPELFDYPFEEKAKGLLIQAKQDPDSSFRSDVLPAPDGAATTKSVPFLAFIIVIQYFVSVRAFVRLEP